MVSEHMKSFSFESLKGYKKSTVVTSLYCSGHSQQSLSTIIRGCFEISAAQYTNPFCVDLL